MAKKTYDFFLPFITSIEEFDEFQDNIAFIKKDSLDTTGIEISTSDIIMLAVGSLANKIREVNAAEGCSLS